MGLFVRTGETVNRDHHDLFAYPSTYLSCASMCKADSHLFRIYHGNSVSLCSIMRWNLYSASSWFCLGSSGCCSYHLSLLDTHSSNVRVSILIWLMLTPHIPFPSLPFPPPLPLPSLLISWIFITTRGFNLFKMTSTTLHGLFSVSNSLLSSKVVSFATPHIHDSTFAVSTIL